jgi:hypothetical protein
VAVVEAKVLQRIMLLYASYSSPPWGRGWVRGVMQEAIFALNPLT